MEAHNHYDGLNEELEKVQKCVARFVTRNYTFEEGSMTGILAELKLETFQKGGGITGSFRFIKV